MSYLDILGKETNEGDIVIKSSSNSSSSMLLIGIIVGKTILAVDPAYPTRIRRITRIQNFYKIENPTEQELKIKEHILTNK